MSRIADEMLEVLAQIDDLTYNTAMKRPFSETRDTYQDGFTQGIWHMHSIVRAKIEEICPDFHDKVDK